MSRVRGLVIGVGVVGIAVGIWFLVDAVRRGVADPVGTVVWLGAGPVLIDLIVIPLSVLIAVGLNRLLPPWARAPIVSGVVLMALTVLVSWPFVFGLAHPANPSTLNRPYAAGLAAVCVVIGCGSVTWSVWRWNRWVVNRSSERMSP